VGVIVRDPGWKDRSHSGGHVPCSWVANLPAGLSRVIPVWVGEL
jgi:hypothetical protein